MLDKRWLTQMKKFINFRYQRTNTWAVYTVKENKLYSYIPDIQRAILSRRRRNGTGVPARFHLGLMTQDSCVLLLLRTLGTCDRTMWPDDSFLCPARCCAGCHVTAVDDPVST
ncbi:hypothetical protein UPYG_G00163770 [Umbra pygmaea]|uniref:Uncharacterized protein n=1 Tax=Umbra pygmaea TaxID=75934 RepID=A0ABD0WN04_UMBPY